MHCGNEKEKGAGVGRDSVESEMAGGRVCFSILGSLYSHVTTAARAEGSRATLQTQQRFTITLIVYSIFFLCKFRSRKMTISEDTN